MMEKLSEKHFIEACAKAFEAGRLGFQNRWFSCRYRYPDGSACAIGAGIPESIDTAFLEGNSVTSKEFRELIEDSANTKVLFQLQRAHDRACNPSTVDHCENVASGRALRLSSREIDLELSGGQYKVTVESREKHAKFFDKAQKEFEAILASLCRKHAVPLPTGLSA